MQDTRTIARPNAPRITRKQAPPNLDHFRLAQLQKQIKAAQGSANYWRAAATAARADAAKHTGERQQHAQARLTAFQQKADEAQDKLTNLRADLVHLDPGREAAAKVQSLRTNINRRVRQLGQMAEILHNAEHAEDPNTERIATWKKRIAQRQQKLDELTQELRQYLAESSETQEHTLRDLEALRAIEEAHRRASKPLNSGHTDEPQARNPDSTPQHSSELSEPENLPVSRPRKAPNTGPYLNGNTSKSVSPDPIDNK